MKLKIRYGLPVFIIGSICLVNFACVNEQMGNCNIKINKIVVSMNSSNSLKNYIAIDSLFLNRENPSESQNSPIIGVKTFTQNQYQYQPFFLGEYSGKVLFVPFDWVITVDDSLTMCRIKSIIKEKIKLTTIMGKEIQSCDVLVDDKTTVIVKLDNKIHHE